MNNDTDLLGTAEDIRAFLIAAQDVLLNYGELSARHKDAVTVVVNAALERADTLVAALDRMEGP